MGGQGVTPEQSRKPDPARSGLICAARGKGSGLKELRTLATRFLRRPDCHKRAFHFQWHSTGLPFQGGRRTRLPGIRFPFRRRDSFVSRVGGREGSKGSGHWKTLGTGLQVPATSVCILCRACGRRRGRPASHRFRDTVPASTHSGSR